LKELTVSSLSQTTLTPFASLPGLAAPAARRSGFAQFFLAPFRDVDDRVARLAAAVKAEREAREAAMSVAPGQRRF
jgi:hypothetical protein